MKMNLNGKLGKKLWNLASILGNIGWIYSAIGTIAANTKTLEEFQAYIDQHLNFISNILFFLGTIFHAILLPWNLLLDKIFYLIPFSIPDHLYSPLVLIFLVANILVDKMVDPETKRKMKLIKSLNELVPIIKREDKRDEKKEKFDGLYREKGFIYYLFSSGPILNYYNSLAKDNTSEEKLLQQKDKALEFINYADFKVEEKINSAKELTRIDRLKLKSTGILILLTIFDSLIWSGLEQASIFLGSLMILFLPICFFLLFLVITIGIIFGLVFLLPVSKLFYILFPVRYIRWNIKDLYDFSKQFFSKEWLVDSNGRKVDINTAFVSLGKEYIEKYENFEDDNKLKNLIQKLDRYSFDYNKNESSSEKNKDQEDLMQKVVIEAERNEKIIIAKKLIKMGMSNEEIKNATELSEDEIKSIRS